MNFSRNDKNPFERLRRMEESELPTYVDGIGFLPIDTRHATVLGIRRMSNMLCLSAVGYFFLQNVLNFPVTMLFYMMGANVRINNYTGLVLIPKDIEKLIDKVTQIIALALVITLCLLVYRQCYKAANIIKRPVKSSLSLAIPMSMAICLLGAGTGLVLKELFSIVGMVLPFSVNPVRQMLFTGLAPAILFILLEEVFFRGCLLTPLRKYGDGFAIVASSLVYAIWCGGAVELIPCFFLSLVIGYFTIRSGSIFTAILCRLCCEGGLLLLRISWGQLETSLALVISLLSVIVVSLVAWYAFISYIRIDRAAFRLAASRDRLRTSFKLAVFTGGLGFMTLAFMLCIRVLRVLQIIG